ncbi:MAG: thioredoxin domain-containing protein, partial [Flavobacteriaceae bacterium]|nr:thioredoxin domain-containing protein [Flavobacteriaceae bacterium]
VPHFEKMLYDNAQLVSLYADAYAITKNELYKNVIEETLTFVERELTGIHNNFYSSLDADSYNREGKLEEGAYYVWQKDELKTILGSDFELFSDYYNVNNYGHWEHKNYVLICNADDQSFLDKHKLSKETFQKKRNEWKTILLDTRNKRHKPRLDDKTLTSWNALMIKGYVDAYRVLDNKTYLDTAIKTAEFLISHQLKNDGGLHHNYKNGKSTINGYLEDYATTIEAFLALYEQTSNDKWLLTARDLANYTFDRFFDDNSKLFFFTSSDDAPLVSRSIEYRDNVVPASNSIMAKNLFKLSHYFNNDHFLNTATTMLNNVSPEINAYPSGFSNWLDLMLNYTNPFYEIAIAGEDSPEKILELNKVYLPNKIIAASKNQTTIPLLENRYIVNETLIFVCVDQTCQLPVKNTTEALKFIKK